MEAFATRKGQALLIYLVCHPKPIPRDLLTGMFWPDSPETAARNSLRHTLSDLRKQFGAFLQSDRQTVEFVRHPPVRLDLDDFLAAERLIQTGASLTEPEANRLETALACYTGEFLAGLNLSDAPAFEEWQFMQCEHLRKLALRGLSLLTDYFIETGEVRRGLAASQRLLALEPWQESAYQQRMLLLVQNGERNAALQLYELCKQTLAAEFGLPPTAQTTGLYEQIVAGVFDPPHGAEHLTAGSLATPSPARGPAGNAVLIAAKIARPGYTTAMVNRPRLYRRLDAWRRVRALAIYAPAGYGKSSLVSRWLDVAGLTGQAGWLNLDEADADPMRFVFYVAAALETVRPGMLGLVKPILAAPQGDPACALHHLLTAFETLVPDTAAEQDVLLVLDDLQRVQAPEVDALLQQLLEQGPAALHILLLARQRTDLRLARLYAQEMLTHLGADEMRFTEEEVAAYLAAKGFDAPAALAVAELTRRSEGWVTALQLAVLLLPHPGDVGELVNALHGTRDWLVEYLVDEVLARQPPELQQFLLKPPSWTNSLRRSAPR